VAILGVPLVVLAGYRGFRISLVADPDGILVKNYFRTYHVRWEDVDAIGLGFHHMGGVLGDAVAISLLGKRLVVTVQATLAGASERQRVLQGLAKMRPDLQIRFSN
jgi:Bacterial PH domain